MLTKEQVLSTGRALSLTPMWTQVALKLPVRSGDQWEEPAGLRVLLALEYPRT